MTADYDRAARIAYKTLIALNIDQLPIDPLHILRLCNNTAIHTYKEIMGLFGKTDRTSFKYDCMDGKEALTLRHDFGDRVGYELLYDSFAHPMRRRFTLAHELGHILLKHHLEEPFEEQEADYFAAQLLAPHPVMELLTDRTPDRIAETFLISRAASKMAVLPPRHKRNNELYTMIQRQFSACLDMAEAI